VDVQSRERDYPQHAYITGFAMDNLLPKETQEQAAARLKTAALGALAENIRVRIAATTIATTVSDNRPHAYYEAETFIKEIATAADAEMVGVKTETHYNKRKNMLYAFAYADRRELIKYYTATIASDMQQIQGLVNMGAQWEQQHEKAKARKQYKDAEALLVKTAKAIDVSRALGASPSDDTWQILYREVVQALARLELLVYVNDSEELFGKPCDIVANKLKAELAQHGYQFTDDAARADFTLNIDATTRKIGNANDVIVFCYADVVVEWVDDYARKSIYKEEFSHKGGSTTFDRAGLEAMEEAASDIAATLYKVINN
jgi:hypothetical protein